MYTLILHHNLDKLMLDSLLHAALSVTLAAYMPRVLYTFSCHQWPDLKVLMQATVYTSRENIECAAVVHTSCHL